MTRGTTTPAIVMRMSSLMSGVVVVTVVMMMMATISTAFADNIPGSVVRRMVPLSTAISAMPFPVAVSQRNLERNSRIRVRNTEGQDYCRKNNELFHICLSLTRDVVFIAVKMDEADSQKFKSL